LVLATKVASDRKGQEILARLGYPTAESIA
jgi:hypothetical protein